MDNQFNEYNTHLENAKQFIMLDPHLRLLKHQHYVYKDPLIDTLPTQITGIYTLTGSRQIGKTTLLKQWMLHLLKQGINPRSIYFFSGEIIDDHHVMLRLLKNKISEMPKDAIKFLIIDEVSYIKDWDKGIKYAADTRLFENTIVVLSGSDLTMLQEARMRFPGRRGKAKKKDFHIYPLSFYEYLQLTKKIKSLDKYIDDNANLTTKELQLLFKTFNDYLYHGGFLTALNDIALTSEIQASTLETYSDWIRGDVLKRRKQERYLYEILNGIIKRYNKQITFSSLAADLSIDHPNTVANYCNLLEAMDALFIQQALLEDKLLGAPKKARKIVFTDPFIYHAINFWLNPVDEPYHQQIKPAVEDSILGSQIVEACVATHFRRYYPTYYIKAEGEVDIAYINHKKFWPIEIKWANQLRSKDLKQIKKYQNGVIYAKTLEPGKLNHLDITPLPLGLLRLSCPTLD